MNEKLKIAIKKDSEKKFMKVPIHRINEVEKARIALYKILEADGFFERSVFNTMLLTELLEPIWYIANRKWTEIE